MMFGYQSNFRTGAGALAALSTVKNQTQLVQWVIQSDQYTKDCILCAKVHNRITVLSSALTDGVESFVKAVGCLQRDALK